MKDCRDWCKKSQADRTMATFKKHFKMWEKDRRLMLTTGTAGFRGANHVEPPAPFTPPMPVAPVNVELVELRAQLQAIQLAVLFRYWIIISSNNKYHPQDI
eukprot:scaffold12552_cov55-Attheya_sp.AAC.1